MFLMMLVLKTFCWQDKYVIFYFVYIKTAWFILLFSIILILFILVLGIILGINIYNNENNNENNKKLPVKESYNNDYSVTLPWGNEETEWLKEHLKCSGVEDK